MARKKRPERIQYDIRNAGVSRAIFMGINEEPRFQFILTASNGAEIEFEMDLAMARTMIEQCIATYHVINPPLKTSRSKFGM